MSPKRTGPVLEIHGEILSLEGFSVEQRARLKATLALSARKTLPLSDRPSTLEYRGCLPLDAFGARAAVATPLGRSGLWRATAPAWRCDFDPTRRHFALWTTTAAVLEEPINVLDILWLPFLVAFESRGGLFLHAASFVHAGHAFVLAGRSGTGKTTLSRRVPVERRLSDDRAIIRTDLAPPTALASPFSGREGTTSGASTAPVSGIGLLEQAPREDVTRLRPAEAFQALFPHQVPTRVPWSHNNPMEGLAKLVEAVPCFRVGFTRDSGPDLLATRMLSRGAP